MKGRIERTDSILISKEDCIYKAFTDEKITPEVLEGIIRLDHLVNDPPIINGIEKTNSLFDSSEHKYLSPVLLMRNLGQGNSLDEIVRGGGVEHGLFEKLARFLIDVYSKMKGDVEIAEAHILKRFQEDIKLIEKYMQADRNIEYSFKYLVGKVVVMESILFKRADSGFVQEIHGDLNLDHIFYVNNNFYLIDFSSSGKYRIDDITRDVAGVILHLLELNKDALVAGFMKSFNTALNDKNFIDMVNIQLVKKNLLKAFIYQGGFKKEHIDRARFELSIVVSKKINKLIS